MTEKFQTVVSKVNKPITYLLTGMLWLVIIIIVTVMGVISENMYSHFRRYIEDDLSTFFILIFAQLLLLFCGIALVMSLTYRKKEKIRKAVIDEKGVTFYNSEDHVVHTILYSELQQSKQSLSDASMHTTTGRHSKSYLKIYLKNKTGDIVLTNINFNFEYVILSNQFEMYRQFLRGIQCFRPDLTISRQTIEEYHLTPGFPPVKNFEAFEYIIAGFFTLTILGLIYTISLLF
ncbi:hypothetical protein BBH99_06065 [Chryseobacterium contaminans]|uniref:Uncharacterized protein n=1 Tax=Chryseobacterium contaminans TaxID=1423959 RepID=A0A1M7AWV7_9FLAO|nr:hypothetical protein [Chryseobacterium contaminans]OCA79473.1 hypothetical protein BBH99_06065 [Chryseobacterium contaminans]SHL47203.1 hypothetical protein SAMN05444407_104145 [Chryseobacterium contaminans]